MNSQQYDIMVIRGGAIELSAASHCAQAQKRVLLLEQFKFINDKSQFQRNCMFFASSILPEKNISHLRTAHLSPI